MQLEELSVLLTANNKAFADTIKDSTNQVVNFESQTAKATTNVSKSFSTMKKVIVGLGIGAVIKKSVGDALTYIGNDTQFMTTMQSWSKDVTDFTEDLKEKLGISRSEMRNFISTMYNMFQGMGIGEASSYKMSKSLSMLSQDMASFYGDKITAAEALDKLQSGLAGNSMALRQLGIMVDDTTVKQYAMQHGLKGTWENLDQSTKAMYRYNVIMEKTGFMHGYLVDTIDSPVTAIRMLKDGVKTLSQTFGQLFIPAISAVLPYLQAFVKMATMGLEAVAKLFNIEIGTALTSELAGASNSAGKVAKGMENAGIGADKTKKSLKDTNKEANKLKKTLAGFDEMNVLQEDGSVSGVGKQPSLKDKDKGMVPAYEIPVIEYDYTKLNNISSKVNDIINGILKSFDKFKSINLAPLASSFGNLIEAIKPLGSIANDVITGFIDKVLYPLTKWTIESLLPSFFNLLTQAINVFTPVLKNFLTFGSWLFDTFLTPLAQWTGGLIVNTLDTLAGAFQKVASSKDALNGLTFALSALMAVKVSSFLTNVSDAFSVYSLGIRNGVSHTEMIDGVTKKYGETAGKMTSRFSPLINLYTKYNNKLLEGKGAMSALSAPSKLLGGVFEKLGTITQDLGIGLQEGWAEMRKFQTSVKEFQTQGEPTRSVIQRMGDAVKDFYANHLKSGVDKVNEFTLNIANKFHEAGGGVGGVMKVMGDGVVSGFEAMKNSVGQALVNIGGGIRSIGTAIAANPLGALLTVFSLLMNSSDEFRNSIQSLLKTALEPIGKVAGSLVTAFQPVIEIFSNVLVGVLSALTPLFQLLGHSISMMLKPLELGAAAVTWLTDKLSGFFGLQTNSNSAEKMEELKEATQETDDKTKQLIESFDTKIRTLDEAGQGNGRLAATYRNSRDAIANVNEQVKKAIEAHVNDKDATQKIKDAYDVYNDTVNETCDLTAELEGLERKHSSSKLNMIDAVKNQEEAQKKLKDAQKETGISYKDLKDQYDKGVLTYENMSEAQRLVFESGLKLEEADAKQAEAKKQVNYENKRMTELVPLIADANIKQQDSFSGLNEVIGKSSDKLTQAGKSYSLFGQDAKYGSSMAEKSITTSAKNSANSWNDFTKTVGTGTNKAFQTASNDVKGTEKQYKSSTENMKKATSSYTSDTKTNLEKNKSVWTSANKVISDDSKKTMDTVKKAVSQNSDEWKKSTDRIKTVSQQAFSEVQKAANTMKETLIQALKGIGNEASTQFSKVSTSGKGSITNIKSAWQGVRDWFKTMFNGIATDMGNSFKNIGSKFNTIANQVITPIGKAINGVLTGLNDLSKKLGSSSRFQAWKIPKFEYGSSGIPQDMLGMVNDQKGSTFKELIVEPGGKAYIPQERNVVMPLKKGTKILPANKTKDWLDKLPKFEKGIGSFIGNWTNSLVLPKEQYDVAKDPRRSIQVGLNNRVILPQSPFDNILSHGIADKMMSQMIAWFKKVFPLDKFGVSGNLKNFVDKYQGKWVDVFGKIGSVGNGGAPNFSGQCASLATAWLTQAFGYWFSANGNGFGAAGRSIGKQDAKAGDIVYFTGGPYGHVGVYAGNNKIFEQNSPLGSKAHISNLLGGLFVRPRGNMKNVPKLERGAIVDKETITMVGENGPEVIMPLENNTQWITKLAKDIDERQSDKQQVSDQPIHIVVNVGSENLVDEVIDGVNDKIFRNNELVLNL